MMLLALVVASAAMFALPAAASAQEIHWEETTGKLQKFTIAGPAGELRAEGKPTITCESTDGEGAQSSTTTGEITLDFTGCHINVLGFTVKCHSAGSELDNTIETDASYHLITWKNGSGAVFPAALVTPTTTTVTCQGTTLYITGEVIGTITSPECGKESKTLGLSFTASGTTQNHMEYTGTKYDLKVSSNSNHTEEKTGALVGTDTLTAANEGKLICT